MNCILKLSCRKDNYVIYFNEEDLLKAYRFRNEQTDNFTFLKILRNRFFVTSDFKLERESEKEI